jgi:hypothetical protein
MSAPVQPVVHTPGPWEVKGPSQNGHCRRIFAGDEYVAIVGGSDQPMKTIRANAALVAAAPLLLEACQRALANDIRETQCGLRNMDDDLRDELRQAIEAAVNEVV